ncbi:hypothetical protein JVT61DRAFT_13707 [Boletus reticuloceps]|uniref:Uncharacterized protein n=1 Tax=Boletus reticuloceps TaxID=495285 RepID=A0A8I2YW86_9AGAM|nr:hypothetical protein JVT61DRAFT_13707 [Boletus reticuloceps]
MLRLKRNKKDSPSQAGPDVEMTMGEVGRRSKRIPEVAIPRKKRLAEEDDPSRHDKRQKRASRRTIFSDDDEDVPRPSPSKISSLKGKARALTPEPVKASEELEEPEGPKVCEACKYCGSKCVWQTLKQSALASQIEKRACTMCVSQKTHCYITGKVAASQPNPLQDIVVKQQQEILEVKEQMKKLAKKLVVQEQEKAQLLSSVSMLEATVAQLSLNLSSHP